MHDKFPTKALNGASVGGTFILNAGLLRCPGGAVGASMA
jgi:hypothetical protein